MKENQKKTIESNAREAADNQANERKREETRTERTKAMRSIQEEMRESRLLEAQLSATLNELTKSVQENLKQSTTENEKNQKQRELEIKTEQERTIQLTTTLEGITSAIRDLNTSNASDAEITEAISRMNSQITTLQQTIEIDRQRLTALQGLDAKIAVTEHFIHNMEMCDKWKQLAHDRQLENLETKILNQTLEKWNTVQTTIMQLQHQVAELQELTHTRVERTDTQTETTDERPTGSSSTPTPTSSDNSDTENDIDTEPNPPNEVSICKVIVLAL